MKNLYNILSIIFYLSKQTYLCKNFLSTPHPPRSSAPSPSGEGKQTPSRRFAVSLRLGHTRALTTIQVVIHSPRAASLPTGEGKRLCSLPRGCPTGMTVQNGRQRTKKENRLHKNLFPKDYLEFLFFHRKLLK